MFCISNKKNIFNNKTFIHRHFNRIHTMFGHSFVFYIYLSAAKKQDHTQPVSHMLYGCLTSSI